MENFFRLTQLAVALLDLKGKVLVATGWQDICTQFHRVHPDSARNCLESDTLLSHGVEPGTFRTYRCKNGMLDVVTPIMVGGRHLGNLFLGQFLFDDEPPDREGFRAAGPAVTASTRRPISPPMIGSRAWTGTRSRW
jgi:ligand-binding sensor protein